MGVAEPGKASGLPQLPSRMLNPVCLSDESVHAAVEAERLTLVYEFFKDLIDPATNRPFFCADHEKRYRTEMGYVLNGDLSDPPRMDMHARQNHLFALSCFLRHTFLF